MTRVHRVTTVVLATVGVLVFSSAPAFAGQGYENVTSKFGEAGSGPGQFKEPTAIAVNDETEEVYVLDSGNDRVEYFALNKTTKAYEYKGQFAGAPGHTFVGSEVYGVAVDNDLLSVSHGDVYVADSGHDVVDKFSASGAYLGQIAGTCENAGETPPLCNKFIPFTGKLNVVVDPAGNVWVYEAEQPVVGSLAAEVYEFNDEGALVISHELEDRGEPNQTPGFAVDASGDIYVTGGRSLYEYETANWQRKIINELARQGTAMTVISSTGNLLLDDLSSIDLFKSPIAPGASPLLMFPATGLSESEGIAVNGAKGEGTLYATQRGSDDVDVFATGPAEKPEILSESASTVSQELAAEAQFAAVINPNNSETTYVFEYGLSKEMVENGEGTPIPGAIPLQAEFGDLTATVPVELTETKETYYYRVVAENKVEGKTETVKGAVESYTKLPLVESESVSGLTSTSAMLEAEVNPVVNSTEYTFEYAPGKNGKETLEQGKGTEIPGSAGVSEPTLLSTEIIGLQPGELYYYRITLENGVTKHTANANKGNPVAGKIKEFTPYAAPAVTTGEAQSITGTAATLSGEVDPEGTSATYHFAYINNEAYEKAIHGNTGEKANPYAAGETTETNALPVGSEPVAVGPIPADDLLPGETYHYALVAVNKYAIQTIGPDHTFTTQAGTPPLVSTGGASAISQNTATLSGTVTTNGLQTNYGFEIGTAPNSYGPATGLGAIGGAASEEVHVTLGELAPGTTYYYRVTATNADGTVQGQPGTFTTPGFPTLLGAPASPPLIPYTSPGFPKEEKPSGTTVKKLTSKEKLAKALKVCRREKGKSKRVACEKAARKKYPTAKAKKKR